MIQLLEESSAAAKEADDWDEIETKKDPLSLWNRVRATHLTNTYSNFELDKLRASKLYNSLKQFKKKILANFKLRTTNALKVLEPSTQAQVC
jgi:hypothetical protein